MSILNALQRLVKKQIPLVIGLILISFSSGCSQRLIQDADFIDAMQVPPEHCPAQPTPPPKVRAVIVLDPGHGGKDLGTHSLKAPKYQEKFLTLSSANMVKTYLERMGHQVIMTRTKDVYIDKKERAAFANETAPEIFVSIHFNSAPNKEAHGIEIFYYRSKDDLERTQDSKKLAESILETMLQETEAHSRGVKHGDYAVLRQTEMTAVLIECGFLTNANEVVKLKNAAYLKKLALGIAQGIDHYLNHRISNG